MITEAEPRKIYSLNVVAYLLSKNLMYESYHKDPDGTVYFIFPECGKYINEYRNSDLHNFLSKYREVRKLVKEA